MRYWVLVLAALLAACSSSSNSPPPAGRGADTIPPAITLSGDNPQVIAFNEAYVELGATASDNRDGDLTAAVVIDATAVDVSTPGDYVVTYNVTDAAGNVATTMTRTVTVQPPVPAEVEVAVAADIKQLIFNWGEPQYVDYYRLMENPDGHSGFNQVGDDIPAGTLTAEHDIAVHLFDWVNAQYIVEACNVTGCSSSDVVTATDVMLDTIGYFKASNTEERDYFGLAVALSADGTTLAVGAPFEDSSATGIDGDQADNSGRDAGAVYVFRFDGTSWAQQAYIKASNTEAGDLFGATVALSVDGNTLAVGAYSEDSRATGINGDQADNSADDAGAVYLFRFDGTSWAQQAYIKASNTDGLDSFGQAVALSADGNTLAVGAWREDSHATGVNGDQADNSATAAGAVYLFRFDGTSWAQQAYIKASNTWDFDFFGQSVALSADSNTLAVGADDESSATGIDGDQADNSASESGAVYLFRFDGASWAQQAYIKASNTEAGDWFGEAVALSANGNTLAVGAIREDSSATGINGDQTDNSAGNAGAVYLFRFDGTAWAQQAYIKASNAGPDDTFASVVALSADGNTLAVGAPREYSGATGIDGDQTDNSVRGAGAVYLFRFDGTSWAQRAYVKPSNTDDADDPQFYPHETFDRFGQAVSLSADGNTLAAGAYRERSSATGINGEQADNSALWAGAVYVY